MRPRTKADKQARLNAILTRLDEMFPNVTCALDHSTPWELPIRRADIPIIWLKMFDTRFKREPRLA